MHLIRMWSFTRSREICAETDIKLWHRMFMRPHSIIQGLYSTNYKSFPFSWSSCLFHSPNHFIFFEVFHSGDKDSGPFWSRAPFPPLFLYFEVFLINEIYGRGLIRWGFGAVLFYCSHSGLPLSLLFLMNWTFYLQEPICSVDRRKCQTLPNFISTSKLATIIFISIFKASANAQERKEVCQVEKNTQNRTSNLNRKKLALFSNLKCTFPPVFF